MNSSAQSNGEVFHIIQTALNQRQYAKVIQDALTYLITNPTDEPIQLMMAIAYVHTGQHEKALQTLVPFTKSQARNPDFWHLIAISNWQLNIPYPGYEAVLKAIELNPRNYEYFQTLSSICITLQRYSEAERASGHCLKLNPNFTRAYVNSGEAKIHLGRMQSAIQDLKKALFLRCPSATLITP